MIAAFAFAAWLSLQAAVDDDLVRAARDPHRLAQFVATHHGFSWEPLWKALGAGMVWMPPCRESGDCSADLIPVPELRGTTILRIKSPGGDVYFRYQKHSAGWSAPGAFAVFVHNHPRRYAFDRIGETPLLRISSQGFRGSDMDSEIEYVFDLTQRDFKPVFSFSVSGHENRHGFGVSRRFSSTIRFAGTDIEQSAALRLEGPPSEPLAILHYQAIYSRSPGSAFRLRSATLDGAPIPVREFEVMVNVDRGPENEALIKLAMPGLRKIANGTSADDRGWLQSVLDHCCKTDTAETRELHRALSGSPRR